MRRWRRRIRVGAKRAVLATVVTFEAAAELLVHHVAMMAASDEVGTGTAGDVLFCAVLHDLFWHGIRECGDASEECKPLAHDAHRSPPAA